MQFVTDADGRQVKKPMVKWKDFQTTRPSLDQVKSWLDQGWFLGVITGRLSGIVVVDDDRVKHGLSPTTLQSTIVAKTKSGGTHYYYKYDRPISNHANADLFVDIRGEGGYCVLPPFNSYEWISAPTNDNWTSLPVLSRKVEEEVSGGIRRSGDRIILSDFEIIPDGERNATLHRLACSTWNNKQLTEKEKISQIRWLNETRCVDKNGNPNPLPDDELTTIINQARTFVSSHPTDSEVRALDLQEVIDSRMEEKEAERGCPSTGMMTLDRMVKGFVPKHTYVLTGDTNVGKTSLACFFACSVASQKRRVLYVALEPDTGVTDYIASVHHNKRFDDLTKDDYNFGHLPIKIFLKDKIRSVDELMKALKTAGRHDLIIIDHIGYFVSNTQNTNQEQSNVMKKLAQIATENMCSVMAIAHIRKPDSRSKPRIPTINDISGSGAFKQDATDVWIVHRTPDLSDLTHSKFLNTGMLIVGKSKSGQTGPIPIVFGERKAGIFEANTLIDSLEDNFT